MQDVCISFWKEDGSSDMMLKVTDICSTDPSDPTYCATPGDLKIDRTKAKIMEKLNSAPTGGVYPEQIWWFFMKCWDDVSSALLGHDEYITNSNSFININTGLTFSPLDRASSNPPTQTIGFPHPPSRTTSAGLKQLSINNG